MKVYRSCGYEELSSYRKGEKYLKPFGIGTNTFKYDDNCNYIHFFLFAESAYHYSKYKNGRFTKYFIECDISAETLKKYYGFGWYSAVIPRYYVPILEFAIPYEEFDVHFICDTSDKIKQTWLRPQEYRQYIDNLPEKYLADFDTGCFYPGYNEESILDVPVENLLGHGFEQSNEQRKIKK